MSLNLIDASRVLHRLGISAKRLNRHPFKFIDLRKPMPTPAHPCMPDEIRDEAGNIVAKLVPHPPVRCPDVMIDIEAYADSPDSAPAQIALVFFDQHDPAFPFTEFFFRPSPISSMRLGMQVAADTLVWWDDHDMEIHPQAGEPITRTLSEIAAIMRAHARSDIRVWSRGNSYDLSILKLLYKRTCMKLPWQFWMERDVRTWLERCRYESPRKNNHHALQDARNQALDIIEATASLQ